MYYITTIDGRVFYVNDTTHYTLLGTDDWLRDINGYYIKITSIVTALYQG